jgi:hypothetical protein
MYLSSYYVSPSRQLANQFTIPYSPPTSGTSAMFGTATGIKNFDDLVAKQDAGTQGPVGVAIGQAYVSFLRSIYPTLQVIEMNPGNMDPVYDALNDGTFDIFIQVREVFCCAYDVMNWVPSLLLEYPSLAFDFPRIILLQRNLCLKDHRRINAWLMANQLVS